MSELGVPKNSIAYRTSELVGRSREKDRICAAVQSGIAFVYLEGVGGIGKTCLLEEISEFVADLSPTPLVLGIIDFYDTAMHGSLSVEQEIVDQLQELGIAGKHFDPFLENMGLYRVSEIDDESKVHAAFIQSFNDCVGERQVILRFDTGEALEYGQDAPEVLAECEVHGAEAPAFQWLREQLGRLEHTTAIVAARPTRELRRRLENAYREEGNWLLLPLDAFSLEETRCYFAISPHGKQIDEEMVERIWLLSEGRPILLSLAIDWLIRGMWVDETYDIDLDTLRGKRKSGGEAWRIILRRFEQALVHGFRRLETPLDAAIYYAARARKGFTADILRRILHDLCSQQIELSPAEAEKLMQKMRQLSFVKHPHGAREGWFFLHDEMYDLVDRYVWRSDYPTYTHQAETAHFLAEKIYGEEATGGLIAEAAKSLRDAKTDPEMRQIRRYLDELRTEQLFYWLEVNPEDGYQRYRRLNIQAISQRNREWDDMLRIEILRFIRTFVERAIRGGLVESTGDKDKLIISNLVNSGCRERWVHRFFARGETEKSVRIARRLLENHPEWEGFWRARVMVTLGAGLQRLGEVEAKDKLEAALQILEQISLGDEDPWMYRHTKATVHLYLGLQEREEGNFRRAGERYEQARAIFEKNGELAAAARMLTNLAYVLIQQGRGFEAIQKASAAVQQRRQAGDEMGAAMSLNTQAIAESVTGRGRLAKRHARQALKILQATQEAGYPALDRRLAMVNLNLGHISRCLADEDTYIRADAEKKWETSLRYFKEVVEREEHLEHYYRFELYNELGALHVRWANWLARLGSVDCERYSKFMNQAGQYFSHADKIAEERGWEVRRANNLEDWAWVFHIRRAYRDRMKDETSAAELEKEIYQRLQRAETLVKEQADPTQSGRLAHYVAGAIYHQWGRYYSKFKDDLSMEMKNYALSVGHFDQFTDDPPERRERVMEYIDNILHSSEYQPDRIRQMIEEMVEALDIDDDRASFLAKELRELLANVKAEIEEGL